MIRSALTTERLSSPEFIRKSTKHSDASVTQRSQLAFQPQQPRAAEERQSHFAHVPQPLQPAVDIVRQPDAAAATKPVVAERATRQHQLCRHPHRQRRLLPRSQINLPLRVAYSRVAQRHVDFSSWPLPPPTPLTQPSLSHP